MTAFHRTTEELQPLKGRSGGSSDRSQASSSIWLLSSSGGSRRSPSSAVWSAFRISSSTRSSPVREDNSRTILVVRRPPRDMGLSAEEFKNSNRDATGMGARRTVKLNLLASHSDFPTSKRPTALPDFPRRPSKLSPTANFILPAHSTNVSNPGSIPKTGCISAPTMRV